MQVIENEIIAGGAIVVLDGKYFLNCRYTDCIVIFCGGDFGWKNTKFERCDVRFSGPAARTFELCKIFGHLKDAPDPAAQPPEDMTVN